MSNFVVSTTPPVSHVNKTLVGVNGVVAMLLHNIS